MKLFTRNSVLFSRLFVGLFLAANSGFTAVLQECTMESNESHQVMECCSISNESSNPAREVQQTAPFLATGSQLSCHTTTVVGGLVGTSALLEKESKVQLSKLGEWSGNLLLQTVFKPISNHSSTLNYFALDVSPPSVEKCVLNSSFLI
jgi:CBS domain containing-hemolysin-like protein